MDNINIAIELLKEVQESDDCEKKLREIRKDKNLSIKEYAEKSLFLDEKILKNEQRKNNLMMVRRLLLKEY